MGKHRARVARWEQIVEAAEKVVIEKGFADSTMNEVAEAAEASMGTTLLYYGSKRHMATASVY